MKHKKTCKSLQVVKRVHTGDTNDYDVFGKRDCRKSKKLVLEDIRATKLAAVFTKVINAWLTQAQLREVRRRNKSPDRIETSCATHDFCDANMAMEEAFVRVSGQTAAQLSRRSRRREGCDCGCKCLSDRCIWLWTEAWEIAKQKGFRS